MMAMKKPHRIALRELRVFVAVLCLAAIIFSALSWVKGGTSYKYLVPLFALFFVIGMFSPISIKPFYELWMKLARVLGKIQSTLILTVVFLLILIPMNLLSRLFEKDLLDEKINPNIPSYWKQKEERSNLDRYEKMF